MKKLNNFEIYGLKKLLPLLGLGVHIENQITGTQTNNFIDIQNTECFDNYPAGYPVFCAFGISEGEDIILKFEDLNGDETKYFFITFSDLYYQNTPSDFYRYYEPLNK